MDLAAARKMLDEFTEVQPMVAPSIYGEPLLIPNLREVLADLKRRGIAVAMNTNGLSRLLRLLHRSDHDESEVR
jgi:wyosine [tRNA(Phe)-imidazoG37] synthetase (radical SAM superfamily)